MAIEGQRFGDAVATSSYFEGRDFSAIIVDEFGNVTREVRSATRVARLHVRMDVEEIESFENLMNSLRGAGLALFVGNTSNEGWAFGFVQEYQVYFNDGVVAEARIIVSGVV